MESAWNRAKLDRDKSILLIHCVYAKLTSLTYGPLYVVCQGAPGAVRQCLLSALPPYLCAKLESKRPGVRLAFVERRPANATYVDLVTGTENVLGIRAKRVIQDLGYLDHALRQYALGDVAAYGEFFRRLEERARELGDPTASNEMLLKIAYRQLEGAPIGELSVEQVEKHLSDALRSGVCGNGPMEEYLAGLLGALARLDWSLTPESEENLDIWLREGASEPLQTAAGGYYSATRKGWDLERWQQHSPLRAEAVMAYFKQTPADDAVIQAHDRFPGWIQPWEDQPAEAASEEEQKRKAKELREEERKAKIQALSDRLTGWRRRKDDGEAASETRWRPVALTKEQFALALRFAYLHLKRNPTETLYLICDEAPNAVKQDLLLITPPYLRQKLEGEMLQVQRQKPRYGYYVKLNDGTQNVSSPKAPQCPEYLDYAVGQYDLGDVAAYEKYFQKLAEKAGLLGDDTASNEAILKIAHRFVLGRIPEEIEGLEAHLRDALQSGAYGNPAMEGYIRALWSTHSKRGIMPMGENQRLLREWNAEAGHEVVAPAAKENQEEPIQEPTPEEAPQEEPTPEEAPQEEPTPEETPDERLSYWEKKQEQPFLWFRLEDHEEYEKMAMDHMVSELYKNWYKAVSACEKDDDTCLKVINAFAWSYDALFPDVQAALLIASKMTGQVKTLRKDLELPIDEKQEDTFWKWTEMALLLREKGLFWTLLDCRKALQAGDASALRKNLTEVWTYVQKKYSDTHDQRLIRERLRRTMGTTAQMVDTRDKLVTLDCWLTLGDLLCSNAFEIFDQCSPRIFWQDAAEVARASKLMQEPRYQEQAGHYLEKNKWQSQEKGCVKKWLAAAQKLAAERPPAPTPEQKQAYWEEKAADPFGGFRMDKLAEYRAMAAEHPVCQLYGDLEAVVQTAKSSSEECLRAMNAFACKHRDRLGDEARTEALGAKLYGLTRGKLRMSASAGKMFRCCVDLALFARSPEHYQKMEACCEALADRDPVAMGEAFRGFDRLQNLPPEERMYAKRRLRFALEETAKGLDNQTPLSLDCWMVLSNFASGGAFDIFQRVSPAIAGLDPREVAGESRLLQDAAYQDQALYYTKRPNAPNVEAVRAWLEVITGQEQSIRDQAKLFQEDWDLMNRERTFSGFLKDLFEG